MTTGVLPLLDVVAAADPACVPCSVAGTTTGIVIAAMVGGGWLLAELLSAWRTRRIRAMAERSDTP
jgi:hypothetical protein